MPEPEPENEAFDDDAYADDGEFDMGAGDSGPNIFGKNVSDMISTGHAEGHPADNVLMEIKGYKFSQNKVFPIFQFVFILYSAVALTVLSLLVVSRLFTRCCACFSSYHFTERDFQKFASIIFKNLFSKAELGLCHVEIAAADIGGRVSVHF